MTAQELEQRADEMISDCAGRGGDFGDTPRLKVRPLIVNLLQRIEWDKRIAEAADHYIATERGFQQGTIGGEKTLALLNLSSAIGEMVIRSRRQHFIPKEGAR